MERATIAVISFLGYTCNDITKEPPNALNQYTCTGNANSFDLLGITSNANVTVNGINVQKQGYYFRSEQTVTNSTNPIEAALTIDSGVSSVQVG